jgi:hypothetical protein
MKVYNASNGDRGRVWLDGIERNDVLECSEEGRYIIKYIRDESGQIKLNASRDAAETETLVGDVFFERAAG